MKVGSLIIPGLFQGPVPPLGTALRDQGFRCLVLCAEEFQLPKESFPGIEVIRCPLDDRIEGLTESELSLAIQAGKHVADAVARQRPALVTCAMGINRSGFVTAVAVTRLLQVSGAEAVRIIKAGRPQALMNTGFVDQLERLFPPPKKPRAPSPEPRAPERKW